MNELVSRDTGGLVVSLLWNRAGNRVEAVLDGTRTNRRCACAVAPGCALDAVSHAAPDAGSDVLAAAPLRTEAVAI